MEINAKYLKKKEPLWEKRQKLIENIPEFWFRVVSTQGRMELDETSKARACLASIYICIATHMYGLLLTG